MIGVGPFFYACFDYEITCPACEQTQVETGLQCLCSYCQNCCQCGSACDCPACLERMENSKPQSDDLEIPDRGLFRSGLRLAPIGALVLVCSLTAQIESAYAKDFGAVGQVYPIIEDDFLAMIKAGFEAMEADGRMEKLRTQSVEQVKKRVERPIGAKLPKVTKERSFTIDLSITLERDLSDQEGRVFARVGTKINPLHYSRFNKRIVMIDGDDPDQVAFALSKGNELDTLIVLARGAPLELMRTHGRRFWFDADQQMLRKFGIAALPSVVTRADPLMLVSEVPVGREVQ